MFPPWASQVWFLSVLTTDVGECRNPRQSNKVSLKKKTAVPPGDTTMAYKFLQMSTLHISAGETYAVGSHLDLIVDGANAVNSIVVCLKTR